MKPRYFYLSPIRRAMKARGLISQRDLARAAGVTQPTISNFFKHRSCRESTALAVCLALGLSINKIRDFSRDVQQAEFPFQDAGGRV